MVGQFLLMGHDIGCQQDLIQLCTAIIYYDLLFVILELEGVQEFADKFFDFHKNLHEILRIILYYR